MASLTPDQLARCKAVFQSFDTNKDGVIDISELKQGLKEIGDFSDEDVKEIMGEADLDENGVIDETEFSTYAKDVFIKEEIPKEDKIEELFVAFDADNDGMIDVDEFLQVMKSLSISDFTEEDAKKVMQIIDLDSDGKITVEELKSFLCK